MIALSLLCLVTWRLLVSHAPLFLQLVSRLSYQRISWLALLSSLDAPASPPLQQADCNLRKFLGFGVTTFPLMSGRDPVRTISCHNFVDDEDSRLPPTLSPASLKATILLPIHSAICGTTAFPK